MPESRLIIGVVLLFGRSSAWPRCLSYKLVRGGKVGLHVVSAQHLTFPHIPFSPIVANTTCPMLDTRNCVQGQYGTWGLTNFALAELFQLQWRQSGLCWIAHLVVTEEDNVTTFSGGALLVKDTLYRSTDYVLLHDRPAIWQCKRSVSRHFSRSHNALCCLQQLTQWNSRSAQHAS